MYVQIGRGAGEVLIQPSVSAHACTEEAEPYAEEGPDSPSYTVELGEGLNTMLFVVHRQQHSRFKLSIQCLEGAKCKMRMCPWPTQMDGTLFSQKGQELSPLRYQPHGFLHTYTQKKNMFTRKIVDKSGLEVSSDLCLPERMLLSFCCLC